MSMWPNAEQWDWLGLLKGSLRKVAKLRTELDDLKRSWVRTWGGDFSGSDYRKQKWRGEWDEERGWKKDSWSSCGPVTLRSHTGDPPKGLHVEPIMMMVSLENRQVGPSVPYWLEYPGTLYLCADLLFLCVVDGLLWLQQSKRCYMCDDALNCAWNCVWGWLKWRAWGTWLEHPSIYQSQLMPMFAPLFLPFLLPSMKTWQL